MASVTILKRIASTFVLLALAGCFPVKYIEVYPKVPLPEQPFLLTVHATELECLAPETYRSLVLREETLRGHIRELRGLIIEHNAGAGELK